MKDDNALHKENSADTNADTGVAKEISGSASKKVAGTPKKSSYGRGLYITAVVLGIIIVLLLVLYIYLSFTHKSAAHTFFVPMPAIARISDG